MLKLEDVTFEVFCIEEHAQIEGNALALRDDAEDAKEETRIRESLESGNPWAWCTVEVRGMWKSLSASDFLGCCSYASEENFCEPGGYFDDMKNEVLNELNGIYSEVTSHNALDYKNGFLHA